MTNNLNHRKILQRIYEKAAATYTNAATIYQETGNRLLERLDYLRIEPKVIVDLGCGTGYHTNHLAQRYPQAQIIALDLCHAMLQLHMNDFKNSSIQRLQGDMQQLPFVTESIDMIFANQSIHDVQECNLLFQEFYRVLRPSGVLFFTTLGHDTLKELKQAWSYVDTYSHISTLSDIHPLGDALIAQNFTQPVVDSEIITIHYRDPMHLLKDLKAQGSYYEGPRQRRGLMGVDAWEVLLEGLEKQRLDNGKIPLTYEIIYGHAWRDKTPFTLDKITGEVAVPLNSLRRST